MQLFHVFVHSNLLGAAIFGLFRTGSGRRVRRIFEREFRNLYSEFDYFTQSIDMEVFLNENIFVQKPIQFGEEKTVT